MLLSRRKPITCIFNFKNTELLKVKFKNINLIIYLNYFVNFQ